MTNNVYVFYNVLTKRYGDIFCAPTDEYASHLVSKAMSGNNPQLSPREFQLCRAASINVETGVVTAASAPIRVDVTLERDPTCPSGVDVDKLCTPSA